MGACPAKPSKYPPLPALLVSSTQIMSQRVGNANVALLSILHELILSTPFARDVREQNKVSLVSPNGRIGYVLYSCYEF